MKLINTLNQLNKRLNDKEKKKNGGFIMVGMGEDINGNRLHQINKGNGLEWVDDAGFDQYMKGLGEEYIGKVVLIHYPETVPVGSNGVKYIHKIGPDTPENRTVVSQDE